jgi:photosystem II stability/assembly factor-like uncharacterized protein
MKRSFVLVPAILLVLFLLNSFVLKEKEVGEKTNEETKSGPVNIVFKSTDGGLTWQDVGEGLPDKQQNWKQLEEASVTSVVESEGVLIATGQNGIRRSTDNGENWQWVISEGGVGIAVERIKGGFAAISYNTGTKSRRIHISLDSGKAWQPIDEGLPPSPSISSIKQMGNYLICGHPDGIFRSSDMGKTWNKVHPGVDKNEFKFFPTWNNPSNKPKKVFKIYVSGNTVYAVPVNSGC